MRGKIYLIKPGVGKIVYENKESEILTFPKSFEDGDTVEFDLANGRFFNITAYSNDRYFGSVITQFKGGGIILVSYPTQLGTIKTNNFVKKSSKVEFKIKKHIDGNIEAIDVFFAKKDELFKTNIPKFGKLKQKIYDTQEGIVSEIVTAQAPKKEVFRGIVTAIREDRGFGFITTANGQDVFFMINWFVKFYNKQPSKGDRVEFFTRTSPKGISVDRFYKETKLPVNEQYAIVEQNKTLLKDLKKVYAKEVEVGDIVYFAKKGDEIILKNNSNTTTKEYLFDVKIKTRYQKGIVTNVVKDRGFGFIKLVNENIDIFFFNSNYKQTYKKEPQKGDKVYLTYQETEKGFKAENFFIPYNNSVDPYEFKNFYKPENNGLYFGYIGDKQKEIYRYDENDLNQSIACYKDKNTSLEFKVLAIECMLKNEYESKKITKEKLFEDKEKFLQQLVEKYIGQDKEKAFIYEVKLQKSKLQKQRLRYFQDNSFIDINIPKEIELIKKEENIKLLNTPQNIEEIKSSFKLSTINIPNEISRLKNNKYINFINTKEIANGNRYY